VARAVAVVSLLGIAAVALSGRRGLEWDRLTRVPDVAWAQVVVGAAAAVVLLVGLRRLWLLWRKLRPRRPERPAQNDGEPMPWLTRLFAAAVVAASIAGCYLVLRLVLDRVPDSGPAGPDSPGVPGSAGSTEGLLPLLLGMVVVLAIALTITVLHRRAAVAGTEEPDEADGEVLADAVVAAEQAMERHDDTRAAIIAAYREMAARLGPAAGNRTSDTPTELLDRAVSAGLVSRGAALELTELFREARFSRHPLPQTARGAAEAALARVSAELGMTRV
jgi:multisubunit Na+/H+ antiporter MnhB subunit